MTDSQDRNAGDRSTAFGGIRPAASMPTALPSWYRMPSTASAGDDLGGIRRADDPPGEPVVDTPVEPAIETSDQPSTPADDVVIVGGVGVVDLATNGSADEVSDMDGLETPATERIGITADGLPFLEVPTGWTDAFTGLDGPMYWARLLSGEGARIRRYHRPATVVLFEVVALDRLARQWGEDVAVQSLLRVGRMLSRHIRSSDHAARIGTIRFGAFLPETNEINAINFVERCRAAILRDLGTAGETVTLAIGWAEPVDGDLDAAVGVAETRLAKEIETAT